MCCRFPRRTFIAVDLTSRGPGRASWHAGDLVDQTPSSHKDIGQVMADQRDLVTVGSTLHHVLNYKGGLNNGVASSANGVVLGSGAIGGAGDSGSQGWRFEPSLPSKKMLERGDVRVAPEPVRWCDR